ncbi:MAG: hypothetical protein MI867_02845 [Pseudomonadales bacterium]|nr:hypothetical protein [Pseudomonadales bacterium]
MIAILFAQFSWANDSREYRKIRVDNYQIAVDADPAWDWRVTWKNGNRVFVYATPEFYYPPANISVLHFPNEEMPKNALDMRAYSLGVIESVAKKYGVEPPIRGVSLKRRGVLLGYEVDLSVESKESKDIKIFIARTSEGDVMSLIAETLPGKISHLEPAITRSWENIIFLKKDS